MSKLAFVSRDVKPSCCGRMNRCWLGDWLAALVLAAQCFTVLASCDPVPSRGSLGSAGGGAGQQAAGSTGGTTAAFTTGGSEVRDRAVGGTAGGLAPQAGVSGVGGAGGVSSEVGWPHNSLDARTEVVPAGKVQHGWAQLDIGKAANYSDPASEADPEVCPDPDEMKTAGTVNFDNGLWTLTGSGEGFIHGWDQGNLVYFKTKVSGDFTFTMKVDVFEMTNGRPLDGAAEALENIRQDLGSEEPTHSIVAGAAPSKSLFMARYPEPSGKWWYQPSAPDVWPSHRELLSWTRIVARGGAIWAEASSDGKVWTAVEHNDTEPGHPEWYPFALEALGQERYVGLVCSARNDRFYAPLVQLPGKTAECKDPDSDHLRASARCVFSHVTLTQP